MTTRFLAVTLVALSLSAFGCASNKASRVTGGTGTLVGMYGTEPIKPQMSGLWIGMPKNPSELGGGPLFYLFSEPVTCAAISVKPKWRDLIPANVQIFEGLVGTATVNMPLIASQDMKPGSAEINYSMGMKPKETHAIDGGSAMLTKVVPGEYIEGTIDVAWEGGGTAKGPFHADWCPTGREF